MIRSLLARGMEVGLAAALLAFAFSFLVGEPQVDQAIDLEARAATTLGLLFGALTERSLQDRRRRQPAAAAP
jgi:Probable cobalt transporter subunit (CbtA)